MKVNWLPELKHMPKSGGESATIMGCRSCKIAREQPMGPVCFHSDPVYVRFSEDERGMVLDALHSNGYAFVL